MARTKSSVLAQQKHSALTERQQKFVDAKMEGKNDQQAAQTAGDANASSLVRCNAIKEEIAKARQYLTDLTTLKRLDVLEGIMDGIGIARLQADAGNVIKGWTEIAKILGLYAPEVKKIELTIGQQRLRSKFEALTDEDLLAIEEGRVIDGEARDLN